MVGQYFPPPPHPQVISNSKGAKTKNLIMVIWIDVFKTQITKEKHSIRLA